MGSNYGFLETDLSAIDKKQLRPFLTSPSLSGFLGAKQGRHLWEPPNYRLPVDPSDSDLSTLRIIPWHCMDGTGVLTKGDIRFSQQNQRVLC